MMAMSTSANDGDLHEGLWGAMHSPHLTPPLFPYGHRSAMAYCNSRLPERLSAVPTLTVDVLGRGCVGHPCDGSACLTDRPGCDQRPHWRAKRCRRALRDGRQLRPLCVVRIPLDRKRHRDWRSYQPPCLHQAAGGCMCDNFSVGSATILHTTAHPHRLRCRWESAAPQRTALRQASRWVVSAQRTRGRSRGDSRARGCHEYTLSAGAAPPPPPAPLPRHCAPISQRIST